MYFLNGSVTGLQTMNSLAARRSARHRRKGFQPASAWMTTSSYLRQQARKKPKFTKVSPTKISIFQLWNNKTNTWNPRITKTIPIILTERDLINWQHFKTQKIQFNQLYLWYATPTQWIPLWALESGFLLLNANVIRYTDVSIEQFTTTKWINLNSTSSKCISQLLGAFNQTLESFAGIANSTKKQKQSPTQSIAGTAYWNNNPKQQLGPPIFRPDLRRWSNYCIYNKHDQRFCYDFVKYFHTTYHQSTQGIGHLMVTNFKQATTKAKIGNGYIYHENNLFIPFWKIDNISIQLNSKIFIKIDSIPDNINTINHISNNRHNSLTRNEFTQLQRELSSLFIDKDLMKYKIEFITNCVGLVTYDKWSKAKNFNDIDKNATSDHTLFFQCQNGYDGFPVGIQKAKSSDDSKEDEMDLLLLNNGNYVSFNELRNLSAQNQIQTGITLDFNGNERLLDGDDWHVQYDYMTQQIAKVDFNNLSKSFIYDYLAGQFILLDFDSEWLLPIYVLNDKFIRAQSCIIHIHDLQNFYQTELHSGNFILKNSIQLEHNYIELTSQSSENEYSSNNNMSNNNSNNNRNGKNKKSTKHVHFHLPPINQIPSPSKLNGLMTETQAKIVSQTMDNSHNQTSDDNIFNQFANTNTTAFNNMTTNNNNNNNNNRNKNNNNNNNGYDTNENNGYIDYFYNNSNDETKDPNEIHNSDDPNESNELNDENVKSANQDSLARIKAQQIQFIDQTEIVPMSHDTITLNRLYSMVEYKRNDYLEKQLRARIRVYEPKAQDRAKYLLHFDLEQLVAALNDDAYLFCIMDKLNKQLEYRKNWSEEARVNRPFWWNYDNNAM